MISGLPSAARSAEGLGLGPEQRAAAIETAAASPVVGSEPGEGSFSAQAKLASMGGASTSRSRAIVHASVTGKRNFVPIMIIAVAASLVLGLLSLMVACVARARD